jgi:hypothetical protein
MTQGPKKMLGHVRDAIQLKHSVGLMSLPAGPVAQRGGVGVGGVGGGGAGPPRRRWPQA